MKSKSLSITDLELHPPKIHIICLKQKCTERKTPKQKSKKKQITKSLTGKLPRLDKAQDDEGEDISEVASQEKSQFHLTEKKKKNTIQRLSTMPLFSRCVCLKRQEREGMTGEGIIYSSPKMLPTAIGKATCGV